MLWVEFGSANGLRPLVVGLWWLGCWGGRHQRGWGGLWQRFCGGFRSGLMFGLRFRLGLLGWWVLATVLWRFCGGFWLRFVPWVFFFFFGGWGLRLWLVVVAVAVAVVRGDELEKLRPWRF